MTLKNDLITDLTTFLNSDEFAVEVTYGAATIKGIFDNAFIADTQDGIEVETRVPQVTIKTSDISGLVHGDTLNINATVYNVIGIEPDGTGVTRVLLSQD